MSDVDREVIASLVQAGAERVLVVSRPPLELRCGHGLVDGTRWTDQISMHLLQQCLKDGAPILLGDAQGVFKDSWSLAASDIRSVICVPYWTPDSSVAGLIYADVRAKKDVFDSAALNLALHGARRIEQAFFGVRSDRYLASLPAEPPRKICKPIASLGLQQAAPTVAVRPTVRAKAAPSSRTPNGKSTALFFRSLATMVGAGLSITRALDICAQHSEDVSLQVLSERVGETVAAGNPLSKALSAHPQAFSNCDCQLVKVAEVSGQLHLVLREIADYREKLYQSQLKLKSALLYPAFVSVFSLAMLLVAPAYLLQGQFELIRSSGQPIPLVTRVAMLLSDVLRGGGLPIGTLLLLATLAAGRRYLDPERLVRLAMKWKGLAEVLTKVATARFAATLALTYRVGIPLQECLRLSSRAAGNPLLLDGLPQVLGELEKGEPLHRCLRAARFFPESMLQMVRGGEEAGKVDAMMKWISRLYESDLEYSMQAWLAALEPTLTLFLGIVVGLLLIATMLPTVNLLKAM